MERLPREVRRRASVVSIFPNLAACLHIVSATLAEISEEWLTGGTYLNFEGATNIVLVNATWFSTFSGGLILVDWREEQGKRNPA